jgi:hypothetical protein
MQSDPLIATVPVSLEHLGGSAQIVAFPKTFALSQKLLSTQLMPLLLISPQSHACRFLVQPSTLPQDVREHVLFAMLHVSLSSHTWPPSPPHKQTAPDVFWPSTQAVD